MPSSQKTFRVFVSSTFTDIRAERRVLQGKVFPDLKKYCEARGASFQAVDLRWGVNEESQREQKTMEICLTEISRCQRLSPRPNFIVLLGDRYGWQPPLSKIPTAEMAELQPHFSDEEAKLIGEWYREDTNAVPPEYVLQPRGETYRDYDQWQTVEDSLRAILRKAAAQTDFTAEQRIKYLASATHQEIINGALQPPDTGVDPADHVFAYLRELDFPPHGEKAGDYLDLMPDGAVDPHAKSQMEGLRQELRDKLPQDHIYSYLASWQDGVQFDVGGLEAFATRVYRDLVSIIDQELRQITAVDELTREKRNQADFARRLIRFFTGQEEPLQRISAYLEEGGDKPLAVIGPSGSGKSCLMAQAIKNAGEMAEGGYTGVIIYSFIGATAASSNPFLLLRQVCAEIAGAYDTELRSLLQEGEDDKKLVTYGGLSQLFPRCLDLASEDKPLWLFLDALDQLQSQLFDFLPRTLAPHVRIVVSALPELEDRLTFAEVYQLPPMPEPDGATLLDKWLATAGRTLTQGQRQGVISKFRENGFPLYLKLAFEQARHWHSYDMGKILPADVEGILAGYFDLLEKEHTPGLVGKVVSYLLSGKYQGLTEAEVLDLLVFDREYWESFIKGSHPAHREEIEGLQKLPVVLWSRLFLDLEPYLTERDADGLAIISFYHRKFREYAEERYLALAGREQIPSKSSLTPLYERGGQKERPGGVIAEKLYATLARYFETQPLYLDDKEENPNVRKMVEQPYQETIAGRWEALVGQSLANFPFLMSKAKAALVEGILEDYALAFEEMPQEWREKLKFWEAFFRERAHILRRGNEEWPAYKILLQLAMEHADDSPVTQGVERYLAEGKSTWPWLRQQRRLKHVGIDPCVAIFEGHTGRVHGALLLPDGRVLSWSGEGYNDHTLRLWDISGKALAVLKGHTCGIKGALALSDGRILSWASDEYLKSDNTLRLWDQDGKPLAVLKGHYWIAGALQLPDGQILSWSSDTLRIWDSDGKPLAILKLHTHTELVKGVLALSDGRILSWASDDYLKSDHTLRLWDQAGKPLAVLQGHTKEIRGARELSDGRILSWARDKTLRIWESDGKPLAVLEGHTDWVFGALELPNGWILSWSLDGNLCLWSRSGEPLAVLKGHTDGVEGAMVLPDGRILSWSRDKTLRIWDTVGKPLAVLEGHTGTVEAGIILSEGRVLSLNGINSFKLYDFDWKPLPVLKSPPIDVENSHPLCDGRIISLSNDKTLRLWDWHGNPLAVLGGHSYKILGTLVLNDGRILSWSYDNTLRLWKWGEEPIESIKGHESVGGVLTLSDGRILSWSRDKTLMISDIVGEPLVVLEGHTEGLWGAVELPDERILSWSTDKTLRLWDPDGKFLSVLEGHTGTVYGALYLHDGRILSWSYDKTLRLWDQAGKPLAVLKGHSLPVKSALIMPNGRILSISGRTLGLWDGSGNFLAMLIGHENWVNGALVLPDGRILSWSKDATLRLWDGSGKPMEVLQSHIGPISTVSLLADGRLFLCAYDPIFTGHTGNVSLWDKNFKPLEVYSTLGEFLQLFPEARIALYGPNSPNRVLANKNAYLHWNANSVILEGDHRPAIVWHGASCSAHLLYPDGRAVVTQDKGQLCVLQLYHGNRPITLDELETLPTTEASNLLPTEPTGHRT